MLCGTFNVTGGDSIQIVLGTGGAGGSAYFDGGSPSTEAISGGASSFGSLLTVSGGQVETVLTAGSSGGTGAGSFCMHSACSSGSYSGAGGTGGSNGETGGSTYPSGSGQGNTYIACVQLAVVHKLTAGVGGDGGMSYSSGGELWQASGGGGGVLLDGNGPAAGDGLLSSYNTKTFERHSGTLLIFLFERKIFKILLNKNFWKI